MSEQENTFVINGGELYYFQKSTESTIYLGEVVKGNFLNDNTNNIFVIKNPCTINFTQGLDENKKPGLMVDIQPVIPRQVTQESENVVQFTNLIFFQVTPLQSIKSKWAQLYNTPTVKRDSAIPESLPVHNIFQ